MPDLSRIDDLRRRVQKDPASIAFAQLAEELRRAGQFEEAVETCRAGLALHPSYLSARVTLGRALVELNQLDAAADELGIVLRSAPENLAAMRAMAEIHQKRGDLPEALAQYRAALAIARNDPDLEETVADLSRKVEPKRPNTSADHLSQHEFLQHLPVPPVRPAKPSIPLAVPAPVSEQIAERAPEKVPEAVQEFVPEAAPGITLEALPPSTLQNVDTGTANDPAVPLFVLPAGPTPEESERDRASRTIVALERWLEAIHDARADLRP